MPARKAKTLTRGPPPSKRATNGRRNGRSDEAKLKEAVLVCKCFKISLRQTLNRRVYEVGNGQWNIPELRTLLEKVLPRKSFFTDFGNAIATFA